MAEDTGKAHTKTKQSPKRGKASAGTKHPGAQGTGQRSAAVVSRKTVRRGTESLTALRKALKQAEERFKGVFDHSPIGKSIVLPDGLMVVNPAFASMLGYSQEELESRTWQNITHKDDVESTEAALDRLLAGEHDSVRLIKRFLHRDGSVVWVDISIWLHREQDGKPLYFLASISDITEQRRAEQRMAYQAMLLNNVKDAIIGSDAQYKLTVWNAAAEALYGWKAEEVLGQSGVDLVRTEWQDVDAESMRRAIAENGEWRGEATQVRRDGTRIPVEVASMALQDGAGNITGYVSVNRDITQRKRADEEIRTLNRELERRVRDRTADLELANRALQEQILERERAQDEISLLNQELEARVAQRTRQLESANQELESFAYSVSHDLRAPLRHIDGFMDLLQARVGDSLDEKSIHYMANITAAASQMGSLIDDLLTFSRMARNEMLRSPVDLCALVEDVIDELRPDAEGRRVQWVVQDLPSAVGDPAMLRLVLVNLISNALKFTRQKDQARVEIGCLPDGEDEIVIYVRDNGVGFDMQYVEKLFNVFQRLHRAEDFEGTGIGLANVRRIISRHGGRVWAEGRLDEGATFYFSLPKAQ